MKVKHFLFLALAACTSLCLSVYADTAGTNDPSDQIRLQTEQSGVIEYPIEISPEEGMADSDGKDTPAVPLPGGASSGGTASGGSEPASGGTTPVANPGGTVVTPQSGEAVRLPFTDIPSTAYYAEAVAWAYSHKPQITAGVTERSFAPLSTCTRGQMVTFLWRAVGQPEPESTSTGFSDVAKGSYYEKAVAWAVENGITTGMTATRFDPEGVVNRAQAVTFLWRAKGKPVAVVARFADVKGAEYYAGAVAWAVENGITNGTGAMTFSPEDNCVRAQTVTFLYRAYK